MPKRTLQLYGTPSLLQPLRLMCLRLDWKKTDRNEWADYTPEGLASFEGDKKRNCVYLIWSEPENRMVYVGSGEVDRLWDHLRESDPQYENIHRHVGLKATYALTDAKDMRGAEGFLALGYKPAEGDRHPREFVKVEHPDNGVPFCSELYNSPIQVLEMRYDLNSTHN